MALIFGASTASSLAASGGDMATAGAVVSASADGAAISRQVLAKGFAEISALRREGDRFHVEAVRPNGAVFNLVLDARDGRVVQEERRGWARGTIPRAPAGMTAEFRTGF